ncbi:MAG: HU family DNA-binding protein [Bacteroidaceae bacterium]|nr:HU family DNA-binding protein [Bacteroidaceae bacterium]
MDRKLQLSDIAEQMAELQGLSKEQAEYFVRSFFEITEEALLQDRYVKVTGFGTTKLVEVSERESVNVNTGERIVIASHSKVSFTPDAILRDLVNAPFAFFTTTPLADATSDEELEAVVVEIEEDENDLPEEEDNTAEVEEIPSDEAVETPVVVDGALEEEVETVEMVVATPDTEPTEAHENTLTPMSKQEFPAAVEIPLKGIAPAAPESESSSAEIVDELPAVTELKAEPVVEITPQPEEVSSAPEPLTIELAEEPEVAAEEFAPESAASESEETISEAALTASASEEMPAQDESAEEEGGTQIAHVDMQTEKVVAEAPQVVATMSDAAAPARAEHANEVTNIKGSIRVTTDAPAAGGINKWMIACFVLLALLLFLLGYVLGHRWGMPSEEKSLALTEQVVETAPAAEDKLADVAPASATAPAAAPAENAKPAATEAPTPSAASTAPKAESPAAPAANAAPAKPAEQPKTNADAAPAAKPAETPATKGIQQLPNGQYKITGTLRTHKIAVGDNLYKLAEQTYGAKSFASYIIVHNRIQDPDLIKVGQTIQLPRLTKQ